MRLDGKVAIIIGRWSTAGDDLGDLHAESYCTRDTSGIASAFALISGRMAGENVAAYVAARGKS